MDELYYDEIEEVSKALFENVVAGIVVLGPSGEVVQTNIHNRYGERLTFRTTPQFQMGS